LNDLMARLDLPLTRQILLERVAWVSAASAP